MNFYGRRNKVDICVRELTEKNEHLVLSSFAAFSDSSIGRKIPEEPCSIRTCYQRDRDRIILSAA